MKIIAIGTQSDIRHNMFTGQSVMFDGVVSRLRENKDKVSVVDISSHFNSNAVILRCIDYLMVLTIMIINLTKNEYDMAYIVTSQSRNGFIRDDVMITLCRWFKIPVITHQYGANYRQLLESLDNNGTNRLRKMLSYVSTIIVEGNYMKEQFSFLPDYRTKVRPIPNGLPIEGKHVQIAKEYDGKNTFVLFYLSNLIWSKGYFDVLQAVDILVNQEHLDVRCIFSGRFMSSADDERPGISNKEDFDRFIVEHQLTDRIEYHQGLYGEEKDMYFYKSNAFLLPSYYINEGQPVSIIEAMAYGCVPLVTEYRHIPMMINDNNGCFVKPRCPQDIAAQIKYLMIHPDIYSKKSKQCIIDYQQNFKFDVYASKVMECMNNIISK